MIPIDEIKTLEIEASSYCNAGCPLCTRHIKWTSEEQPNLIKKHITYKQIQSLFADTPTIEQILFCGVIGDPIMNPDIFNILQFVSTKSKNVRMDTNASLRSTNFWTSIGKLSKEHQKFIITFSIDGLENTNHIYRVNTNFNKIIENAKAYINAGGNATWKYIIFKHNEHQIEEAENLSKQLGFETFITEHGTRWSIDDIEYIKNNNPILQPSSFVASKLRHKMKGVVENEKGLNNRETVQELWNNTTQYISCKTIQQKKLFIDVNFNLWPCCFFAAERQEYQRKKYWDPYWKSIEDIYGENFNNLNTTNLITLLKHPYFMKTLPESWETTPQQYLCKIFCNERQYWNKDRVNEDGIKVGDFDY